eukprot:3507135-Pyramimonas_sp.AAC.1
MRDGSAPGSAAGTGESLRGTWAAVEELLAGTTTVRLPVSDPLALRELSGNIVSSRRVDQLAPPRAGIPLATW